ncbi:MAG: efflux RND transporter periplasmic adaptor subunit, partial [Helcococcus sp.]|nr:efflux RND transporter periplasmic adaptor subunit [Helcococcus sp.]
MKLYNKENLKNSRIFFDKRPPKFMIFLVYFTLIILILLLFAASRINKNYIVKANGQISDKNIKYISSNINGTIKEVKAKEGTFVKRGDIILVVSNGEENIQRKEYEKILENNRLKKELLVKYRKSLDEKTNYLSDSGVEQEYYGKVEYYLGAIKSENQSEKFTSEDINKKQKKLNEKINEKDTLNSSLNKLEKNKNYYKDLVKYYEKLNFTILDLQEEITKLKDSEQPDQELIN